MVVSAAALFLVTAADAAKAGPPFRYEPFLESVQVPGDFKLTLSAGDPAIRFPMFACFDDQGRLYVAESSGEDLYAG